MGMKITEKQEEQVKKMASNFDYSCVEDKTYMNVLNQDGELVYSYEIIKNTGEEVFVYDGKEYSVIRDDVGCGNCSLSCECDAELMMRCQKELGYNPVPRLEEMPRGK